MRNVAVLPPVKSELQAALLNVPEFKNFATHELIAMARALPGGTKIHTPDRLTAIVVLLGPGRWTSATAKSLSRIRSSFELCLDRRGR